MPRSARLLPSTLLACLALAGALGAPTAALADPPDWAGHGRGHDRDRDDRRDDDGYRDDRPDPGWRDREEAYRHSRDYGRHVGHAYRGYGGDDWDDDYGIVSRGRCNSDAVLGVVGAVTGGIIGHNVARPGDRGIATVLGAITGGVIGSAVGSSIDDGDRACMGHALELAPIGRPVVWVNPRSHLRWRMVPVRDVSPRCREFDLYRDGRRERAVACRRGRGDWAFRD